MIEQNRKFWSLSSGEALQVDGHNESHSFASCYEADTKEWTREMADRNGTNCRKFRPVKRLSKVIQWMREAGCTQILVVVQYDVAR